MKETIITFVKEHKKGLCNAAIAITGFTVGYLYGRKYVHITVYKA